MTRLTFATGSRVRSINGTSEENKGLGLKMPIRDLFNRRSAAPKDEDNQEYDDLPAKFRNQIIQLFLIELPTRNRMDQQVRRQRDLFAEARLEYMMDHGVLWMRYEGFGAVNDACNFIQQGDASDVLYFIKIVVRLVQEYDTATGLL